MADHDDAFVGRLIREMARQGRKIHVPHGDRPITTPLKRRKRPKVEALRLLRAGEIWNFYVLD